MPSPPFVNGYLYQAHMLQTAQLQQYIDMFLSLQLQVCPHVCMVSLFTALSTWLSARNGRQCSRVRGWVTPSQGEYACALCLYICVSAHDAGLRCCKRQLEAEFAALHLFSSMQLCLICSNSLACGRMLLNSFYIGGDPPHFLHLPLY